MRIPRKGLSAILSAAMVISLVSIAPAAFAEEDDSGFGVNGTYESEPETLLIQDIAGFGSDLEVTEHEETDSAKEDADAPAVTDDEFVNLNTEAINDANENNYELHAMAYKSRDSAVIVSVNDWIDGELTSDDTRNWYVFELDNAGQITLEGSLAAYKSSIILYDSEERYIWSKTGDVANFDGQYTLNETINLMAGRYYLCAAVDGDNYGNYSFCIEYKQIPVSYEETIYTNNNTIEAASIINNNVTIKGFLSGNNKIDYYSFTIEDPKVLDITVDKDEIACKLAVLDENVELWDQFLFEYKTSSNYSVTLAKGTYFFSIERYNQQGTYELTLTLRDWSAKRDDDIFVDYNES